ncbi:hypothetical protein FOZ62_028644, partial [Perkinsus olseni]
LKEARRRGGDRISENVRSNPSRTPRAKWMAQCLQTIHREMRHEENRKRRVEMQRLDDEKVKEAVDNKNVGSSLAGMRGLMVTFLALAFVKSPTEAPRRVVGNQRQSMWKESVDSARQKTLAVVYSLVRLLQQRWRGVLARRRARVEVLRRRIERMAVVEEEQAQRGDRRPSEEGWPTVGQERVSSAFFESIIDLPLTRKGEEELSLSRVMDSTPPAVTRLFLYDYVVGWEKMKGRQGSAKRREQRIGDAHGSWRSPKGAFGGDEGVYDAASDVRGK